MTVYYWDAGMKRSDSYSSVTTSGNGFWDVLRI